MYINVIHHMSTSTEMSHFVEINLPRPTHPHFTQNTNKSHDAAVTYPIMHHFISEMCTCVQICVMKWCIVGYLSNALWDFLDGSIKIMTVDDQESWNQAINSHAAKLVFHA